MIRRRHARTTLAVGALLASALWLLVPAMPASAATSLTVTPDTGLSGGQDVSVVASGLERGHTAGWCQGVPSVAPASLADCGVNTTSVQTVDPSGQISGMAHLQRFIYVPAISRWVDCTDPGETCIMGAADAADIAGTVATAPLSFAAPPEPPATRGTIDLSVGDGGFTVTGTGFRPEAVVDVFECATGATDPSGCGLAKVTTTAGATGGFQVTVAPDPFVQPPGGDTVNCIPLEAEACSIVAAEAVDFPGTNVGVPLPVLQTRVPTITPGVAYQVEGNAGETNLAVPVTLSNAFTQTVTAQWNTLFVPDAPDTPYSKADPATDYTPGSGTVTFAPGEIAQTVTVEVNGDALVEPDEYIVVSFHDPTNANMGGYWGLGFGIITNDEHATVVPGQASAVEGDSGTTDLNVPVTLSNPSTQTITVLWNTLFVPNAPDSKADPATDYTPASGTVTFAPGETTATVTVAVNGDTLVEPDEYIVVSFHDPSNALMGGYWGLGFGIIANDD